MVRTALEVRRFDFKPARVMVGSRNIRFEPVRISGSNRFKRFEPVARKLPRDINTEMFTKRVAVRAVNFSIGPFCTEFRCEQLCDDDFFFLIGVNFCAFFGILHGMGIGKSTIRIRRSMPQIRKSENHPVT